MTPTAQFIAMESTLRQQQALIKSLFDIISQINSAMGDMEQRIQRNSRDYIDRRMDANFQETSGLRDEVVAKLRDLRDVLERLEAEHG